MGVLSANVERVTCAITGVGRKAKVKVLSLQGSEGVSSLFSYTLRIVCEDAELDFDAIVGRPVVLTFLGEDESVARHVHAMVVHIEQIGQGMRLATYELRLAPQAWLLTQRTDCRIFQNTSVPDIIKEVLTAAGLPSDRFKFSVKASYPPRDYCVQYRESDFEFISRLMEEEGIFYFFEHNLMGKDVGHVMVFTDHSTIHKTISGKAAVLYHPSTTGIKTEDSVFPFSFRQGVRSGSVVLKDFDFRKPVLKLKPKQKHTVDDQLEVYDFPGRLDSGSDGDRLAKVRLEGLQVPRKMGEGESDCLRFIAGYYFTLDEHPRESLNQEYLLTRVETWIRQPQVLEEGAGMEPAVYQNRFSCIPAVVQFRAPQVTPKPTVQGVQTAIVVGPAGEEIYPDEYARVKVQFHWDRKGKNDEKSSCWIRVSQLWAGAGWGAMFIPRIGHEVIVDFVEGDPDRPIITGRVYHGTNKPPYKLPDERTKSTIKSNSSKGGGGSNELRFEDKKGSEEVYLHGQKDWTIKIENDKNQDVGHDETLHVGNDRTKTVDHDQSDTIGNDKSINVGHNHTEFIGANKTETVAINCAETIGVAKELTIGGAYAVTVGAGMNTAVGLGQAEEVGLNKTVMVGKKFSINAGDELSITVGNASLVMKADGTVIINGSKFNFEASGPVQISGKDVDIN